MCVCVCVYTYLYIYVCPVLYIYIYMLPPSGLSTRWGGETRVDRMVRLAGRVEESRI